MAREEQESPVVVERSFEDRSLPLTFFMELYKIPVGGALVIKWLLGGTMRYMSRITRTGDTSFSLDSDYTEEQ